MNNFLNKIKKLGLYYIKSTNVDANSLPQKVTQNRTHRCKIIFGSHKKFGKNQYTIENNPQH